MNHEGIGNAGHGFCPAATITCHSASEKNHLDFEIAEKATTITFSKTASLKTASSKSFRIRRNRGHLWHVDCEEAGPRLYTSVAGIANAFSGARIAACCIGWARTLWRKEIGCFSPVVRTIWQRTCFVHPGPHVDWLHGFWHKFPWNPHGHVHEPSLKSHYINSLSKYSYQEDWDCQTNRAIILTLTSLSATFSKTTFN